MTCWRLVCVSPCRIELDWDVAAYTIGPFPCKRPRSNLDKAKSWSKTTTASQRINRLHNLTFVGCTTEEFTAGQFVRVVPWLQNWICSAALHDLVVSFQSAMQVFEHVDSIGFHPKYQKYPRDKLIKTGAKENISDLSLRFLSKWKNIYIYVYVYIYMCIYIYIFYVIIFLSFRWVSRPKVSSTANLAYSWNGTRCCGNLGIYGVVLLSPSLRFVGELNIYIYMDSYYYKL